MCGCIAYAERIIKIGGGIERGKKRNILGGKMKSPHFKKLEREGKRGYIACSGFFSVFCSVLPAVVNTIKGSKKRSIQSGGADKKNRRQGNLDWRNGKNKDEFLRFQMEYKRDEWVDGICDGCSVPGVLCEF